MKLEKTAATGLSSAAKPKRKNKKVADVDIYLKRNAQNDVG